MPYSKDKFDADKQNKFKVAVAIAAGTEAGNVIIKNVAEGGRRVGSASVNVETEVRIEPSLRRAVKADLNAWIMISECVCRAAC